jgi:hypothetical protein
VDGTADAVEPSGIGIEKRTERGDYPITLPQQLSMREGEHVVASGHQAPELCVVPLERLPVSVMLVALELDDKTSSGPVGVDDGRKRAAAGARPARAALAGYFRKPS